MARTTSLSSTNDSNKNWPMLFCGAVALASLLFAIFKTNPTTTDGPNTTPDDVAINKYDYDGVCFVVGNTANSPKPDFESSHKINIKKTIESVLEYTETGMLPNICMYSATINPKEIEIKGLSEKFDNDYAIASQKEEIAMQVKNAASQSPAEGGADYFQAIIEAADSLQGAQNPLIVVYGSGLSDHGILNFADDGLLSKADDYAIAQLSQTKIRKNEYRNTEIIWLGAGETINDNGQEPLDADCQKKVEDIYISALGYIGMKPSFGKIQITKDTTSVSNTYHVNPTMIPGKLTKGYTKHLDERVAKFLPGSSTLSNPDEVKRMLMEFAKEFKQTDNSLKLKITGYHAKCTGGSDKEFSKRRAAAIGDILIKELNIDASRIIVDGVGGPQDDREEVTCDSEIAKEHRVVILEVVE